MRKIRDILRLKYEAHFGDRQIAAAIDSSRSTVLECLRRCRVAGIAWPLPETLDESALIAKLYRRGAPAQRVGVEPDFALVHRERARRGVTRDLLWREYKSAQPQGVQYTAFCNQYRPWQSRHEFVFRQVHAPGEKLFVDYAGQTIGITDRHTGESRPAQIFVAVLGASNQRVAVGAGR